MMNGVQIDTGGGAIKLLSHVFDAKAAGASRGLELAIEKVPWGTNIWLCVDSTFAVWCVKETPRIHPSGPFLPATRRRRNAKSACDGPLATQESRVTKLPTSLPTKEHLEAGLRGWKRSLRLVGFAPSFVDSTTKHEFNGGISPLRNSPLGAAAGLICTRSTASQSSSSTDQCFTVGSACAPHTGTSTGITASSNTSTPNSSVLAATRRPQSTSPSARRPIEPFAVGRTDPRLPLRQEGGN